MEVLMHRGAGSRSLSIEAKMALSLPLGQAILLLGNNQFLQVVDCLGFSLQQNIGNNRNICQMTICSK